MTPMPDDVAPHDLPTGPLSHVTVLDLTTARSGPTCVRQLADLGAQVVQVAMPGKGNLAGSDGYNLHRNKRSIALDLKHPDGLAAFLRLAETADVLVENMRPSVKHRLGIGPDVLCEHNPRLVYASISGFGQDGPYAERPGVDQIAQGLSGIMSVTGPPGTGPWRVGIAISDTASGTFLTQGVLAALLARERTGRGQWLHTSLLESAVNFLDFQACRWLTDGVVPPQEGNNHPTFFPMGTYRAADGHLNIAGLKSIESFLDVLGARHLLDDERFATAESRRANRNAFDAACEAQLTSRPAAYWVEALNAAGIPAGPVYRVDEVFADPQVQHLGLTATVPTPDGREAQILRYPVTLTATPASVRTGPPAPGTHTREVLAEAGYDQAAVDALLASGAAGLPTAGGGASWLG
jgi:crotonobetainyl-CoA:carnitine CoA-transferase CaiB-like acyl-CoA transferase